MKNYTKAVLYAYPILGDLERAYGEHIKNKAVLSYRHVAPCEGLVEYIAEQIGKKDKLTWLEGVLDGVVERLGETERALLQMRYFGKKGKAESEEACKRISAWSESTYFRRQRSLEKRVESMLKSAGLTEQVFDEWFAPMQAFRYVCGYLQRRESAKAGSAQ